MSLLRRIVTSLATGYVVFFWSERVFWARPDPEVRLSELIITWVAYSLMAAALLTIIDRFRVRGLPTLFLAGAVFGWIAEGIVVQTLYDDFPLNISWTGLAWHSLISVIAGWWLVRRALIAPSLLPTLKLAAGLGLFWGAWAVWWWDELGFITPVAGWAAHAYALTALLILAFVVERAAQPNPYGATAVEGWLLAALAAFLFVAGTVPQQPLALWVLPPLMALVFWALRRHAQVTPQPSLLADVRVLYPWPNMVALLALPTAAVMVYAGFVALGHGFPTHWVVFALTMPAGFGLLVWSLILATREASPDPPACRTTATNPADQQ